MPNERFEMKVPTEWLKRLDEWRERQPIPPSRAAAIRYLVDIGLDHIPIRDQNPEPSA